MLKALSTIDMLIPGLPSILLLAPNTPVFRPLQYQAQFVHRLGHLNVALFSLIQRASF